MKTKIFLLLFFISLTFFSTSWAANSRDALVDLQVSSAIQKNAQAEVSLTDGKAYAYKVSGNVTFMKSGSPVETKLKVGDLIQAGDKVLTEKGAVAEIAFDIMKKNAIQIPQDTTATFTSIEPTDIKLDNGSIFSAIDGLAKGSSWKVTTPVAVAAVRGTVFMVGYEASSKEFFAATLNVVDDGKISAIEIQSLTSEGNASVAEGKEISFKEGDAPTQGKVQDLSSDKTAEIQQFHQEVNSEREKTAAENDENKNGSGNGPGGPSGPGGGSGGPNATGGNSTSANGLGTTSGFAGIKNFSPGGIDQSSTLDSKADKEGDNISTAEKSKLAVDDFRNELRTDGGGGFNKTGEFIERIAADKDTFNRIQQQDTIFNKSDGQFCATCGTGDKVCPPGTYLNTASGRCS